MKSVMEHAQQHKVPASYLRSWCDPATPQGYEPYVHVTSKDGQQTKRKAPRKIFTETDAYTITLPSGERELIIERTLGLIEDRFVRVRDEKIETSSPLDETDRADLCAFMAAMSLRTDSRRNSMQRFANELHETTTLMEEDHQLEPQASLWTGALQRHAHQYLIGEGLGTLPGLLFAMRLVILETVDPHGFITSDDPCVWWNPKAYQMPPFYRSPGLAQRDIEVTLPVSPRFLAVVCHHEIPSLYRRINTRATDELNRRTRAHSRQSFVTWNGETRPIWFDMGTVPDDAWEKRHKLDEES
jgi:hypothetical protein